MSDVERERIEQELEGKLGFRWTPQMRHGYKALKLWDALVNAVGDIKRLRELCGYAARILAEPPQVKIGGYRVSELCERLRKAAEAKEK